MKSLTLKNTTSPLKNVMVRILEQGDGYGQYNEKTGQHALTHERAAPVVEFYDLDVNWPPFGGQFVQRYRLSSLLERESGGLPLDGGVPKWTLDDRTMNEIRQFLRAADAQIHYEDTAPTGA
jgi:hypothetical protein